MLGHAEDEDRIALVNGDGETVESAVSRRRTLPPIVKMKREKVKGKEGGREGEGLISVPPRYLSRVTKEDDRFPVSRGGGGGESYR